jgi:ubiquinone/menaquinone biosynthesis C-methylase UbiE
VNHADHVALLRAAVEPGGVWADMGAGSGAFTLALADLLGPGGRIVAVDRDAEALREMEEVVGRAFPQVLVEALVADFRRPLSLPVLDGLVAANSLHFVARDQQAEVVRGLAAFLRPRGRFVVVEYDADRGNPWAPHPFSYAGWVRLAEAAELVEVERIGRVPSRFLAIYSAMARRPVGEVSPYPGRVTRH